MGKGLRIITILVAAVTVLAALYIMARGLGLAEGLDFGAGAYYYADIPGFEKILREDAYTTEIPFWVYLVLFLGWGWLMYRLWVRMERKAEQKEKKDDD